MDNKNLPSAQSNFLLYTAADGEFENLVISILEHTAGLTQLLDKFEQLVLRSATLSILETVQI